MNKLFTIIIPCYNCEKTLEEAVNSCYVQNLPIPFEIIMVDDASTDSTRNVMSKLSQKNKEIKLFYHKENKGGGAARNTAVANSSGEVIFCLDSDDILPPNTLSKMYKYLVDKQCDGVTIHRSIKFNSNNTKNISYIDVSPYINIAIPFESLLLRDKFCPIYVNFLYTKDAFIKLGGYPTSHGYDTQGFAWRFACAGLTAYTCPESEYFHRVNFNESYYQREYNNGKINYNWRDILLEHYYIFNKKALNFILSFKCEDFTKNIFTELTKVDDMFIPNFKNAFGKKHPILGFKLERSVYVKKNSVKGVFFRIRNRIKLFFQQ